MQRFVSNRILFFLGTADADAETEVSPSFGPHGFVQVLDEQTLAYPEYRGNGVHESLGNMYENAHTTMLFMDWWDTGVGLHINGTTTLQEDAPADATDLTGLDKTKQWVVLELEGAYIHCAKHVPQLSIEEFNPPGGNR